MDATAHDDAERKKSAVEPAKDRGRGEGRPSAASPFSTDGRMSPSAARLFALQRAAGNRATGAALRASRSVPSPVQRSAPVGTGEQLAFAPKELPEESVEVGPIKEKSAEKAGAAAPPAGSNSGEPTDPAGGGAGTSDGAGMGAAPATSSPPAAPPAPPAASGADDPGGATQATGAIKSNGAVKSNGAIKAAPADGAIKAAPADGAIKANGADKAAGALKAAGADKAAGVTKALEASKRPPSPPLPAKTSAPAAKAAATVKSVPSPQTPKQFPARIDTEAQPTDFLRVAAPKLQVAGAAEAPVVDTGLPPLESLTVLRRPGGGGGGGPAPAAPSSADAPVWGTWTLDDLLNGGRTVLELSRFIPMYGMIGGLAADGMGAYQDFTAIPAGEYPITQSLVVLRSGINAANNVVGHLMYVGTLIQDGLAGSVVGAEFVPVSAGAMETFAATKVGLDIGLFYADMGVEIGALWNQSHSGPEQWGAWQGIVDGYQANLLGDVVGLVLDTVTLSTAGAANVDSIKAGTGIFNTASILAQRWGGTLVSFAQGMFNVWGSKAPLISGEQVPIGSRPPPAPAPAAAPPIQRLGEGAGATAEAAAMRAAAGFLNVQTAEGRVAWNVVDAGIGALQEEATKKMAELNAMVMQLSGGKNLFQVIQEGAMSALGEMRSRLETLEQMQQSASDAETNGTEVRAWAEDVLTKIDAFTVPNVTASPSDFGDGMLADAAEYLADSAGDVAAAILNTAIAGVRVAVDDVKAELRTPIEAVRDTAVEIGEFLAIVARVSTQQTASIRGYIQNFEQGLGQCTGFEDAVNLIIGQVTQLLGVPSFNVQDIRNYWQSLPGHFDDVDALAARLVVRAARLEREASVQTMPEMAAPAPDPEDEDADGAGAGA